MNLEGIFVKPRKVESLDCRAKEEVIEMEKTDVSAIENIVKEKPSPNDDRPRTNYLDHCRSANDGDPRMEPLATGGDVPEAEERDGDSKSVGDVSKVARGKQMQCRNIGCLPVKAILNVPTAAASPLSSNLIEIQAENIAVSTKMRNTFDSKSNLCPFDYESFLENGLIYQKGSERKSDIKNPRTDDDEFLVNVTNDDLIDFLAIQEDSVRKLEPRRTRVTLYPTNVMEEMEKGDAASGSRCEVSNGKCEVENHMKTDEEEDVCFDPLCSKCRPTPSLPVRSCFTSYAL